VNNITNEMILFGGSSNIELSQQVADYLNKPLAGMTIKKFKDSETYIKLNETVRGKDVFLIQSTSCPVNEHLMELLIMADAMRRDCAKSINVVIPYYGYARQDRKASAREAISAKLVADLISAAGVNSIITIDLHSPQIQGFFNIPHTHLTAFYTFANYFKEQKIKDMIIVAPDAGSAYKTRKFADILGCGFAILHKKRPKHNVAEIIDLIGDVKGKSAIIFDDIIDTGGTIVASVNAIKERGAKEVYVAATHGVMSPPCIERMKKAPIKQIVVTNSVHIPKEKRFKKMVILPLGYIIGEAMRRHHKNLSISEMFTEMSTKLSGINQKITEFENG
jgi:ribose-phosphate pyrophosphokinase